MKATFWVVCYTLIWFMAIKHSIGPIENVMDVILTTSKGKMLDRMEKFYIYKETRINNQIKDKGTVKPK